MNIGEVFSELSAGKLMTRAAWEVDEFVYLVPGSTFTVNRPPLVAILGAGTTVTYRPHTDRRYADGTCGYWAPSKEDAEAHDWSEFVEPAAEPAPTPAPSALVVASSEPAAPVVAAPVAVNSAAEPAVVANSPAIVEPASSEPAAAAVATSAPSAASEPAQAPVAAAPTPTPVNVTPAPAIVRIVWYVQETPKSPIFTPQFWDATDSKWISEAASATPYDTMQQAVAIAQTLPASARVVHYARVGQ